MELFWSAFEVLPTTRKDSRGSVGISNALQVMQLSNRLKKIRVKAERNFYLKDSRQQRRESSNVKHNQFWRHDNKPIELWSNKVISEKIRYIHNNPVEEGLVFRPEDYRYSSAVDYSGEKGLLDGVVLVSI
jgi:hypothetical protein